MMNNAVMNMKVQISKVWKQSTCLSVDEWIKKMWYRYKMKYYLTGKKGNPVICNNKNETEGHYAK